MKNIVRLSNIDELPKDTLSLKIRKKHERLKYGRWNKKYYFYFKIENISIWKYIDILLTKNIGKSFNLTFSYYCKKVPQRFQKDFLEEFQPRRYYSNLIPEYYIDDKGLIQYGCPYWKTYRQRNREMFLTFQSHDYQKGWKHILTGNVYEKFPYKPSFKGRPYSDNIYSPEDFEEIAIKGFKKVFESTKNPEFIKLKSQDKTRKKAQDKREKKNVYESQSELLGEITKERKERERIINEIKIESHGFDKNISFRKRKL